MYRPCFSLPGATTCDSGRGVKKRLEAFIGAKCDDEPELPFVCAMMSADGKG